PCLVIGPVECELVARQLWSGHTAGPVRGDSPSCESSQWNTACGAGIFFSHQHDHAASFTGPEPVGSFVVEAHLGACEGAGLGEANDFEGVDRQVDSPGDGHVEVTVDERAGGSGY